MIPNAKDTLLWILFFMMKSRIMSSGTLCIGQRSQLIQSAAFNYLQFIAVYVSELNESKASPQQALTAEAAIVLKLSEYNNYVENGYFFDL